MGTVIYNESDKVSRIVELKNDAEKEAMYEHAGILMGAVLIAFSMLLLAL